MKTTDDFLNAKSNLTDHLMNLVGFLASYKEFDGADIAGFNIDDALESVQALLGYDDETFEKLLEVFVPDEGE